MNDVQRSNAILLSCLLDIRQAVDEGCVELSAHNGICAHVDRLWSTKTTDFRDLYMMTMDQLFASWPEFSGNIECPVPSPSVELTARRAYHQATHKWVGEYGAARIRLLDWMIEQLQEAGDE